MRSRRTITLSSSSPGAENLDKCSRTVRVRTVRWTHSGGRDGLLGLPQDPVVVPAAEGEVDGGAGAVKSRVPRPPNPPAPMRSTGPASSAWPDRLSNRTTWLTRGDSSGEQVYSLRADEVEGAERNTVGAAVRRHGDRRGGVEHPYFAAVVHSRQPEHGGGAEFRDLLLAQADMDGTALRGGAVRQRRAGPRRAAAVPPPTRSGRSTGSAGTFDQSSPVFCQTIASVSRVRSCMFSTARYAGRHSAHGVRWLRRSFAWPSAEEWTASSMWPVNSAGFVP
ncbi:hypothetical protein SHIRM173S_12578 [Streptomyces hirsutus]